jgi:hypothetical protein
VKLKPGDTVRVLGERGTSKIRSLLTAVNGVLLETEIGGFRNWNTEEVRFVRRGKLTMRRTVSEQTRAKAIARWRERNAQN